MILWDVRVSDSDDVDPLYYKTSRLAKELDVYRQTGGVRDFAGSRFFEDVYLYDDMSQDAGRLRLIVKISVRIRPKAVFWRDITA